MALQAHEKSEADVPPSGSTRDRILDAAEALFADRGYAGAAMRDLAARVDLNPASLYNHFPSKRALYEAVLERGLRPMSELLESLQDVAPGCAKLLFAQGLARGPIAGPLRFS